MQRDRDKELDDLFKNAMQNNDQHIDFREEDWVSMEQMLNRSRKGRVLWLRFASGIAALLLLFAGYWFMKPKTADNHTTQQAAIKKVKPTVPADTVNKAVKQTPLTPSPNTVPSKSAEPVYAGTTNDNRPAKKSNTSAPTITQQVDKTNLKIDDRFNMNDSTAPAIANNKTNVDTTADYIVTQPAQNGDTTMVIAQQTDAATQVPATTTTATINETAPKKGLSYALSIMASPDINGVGSFSDGKTGTNVGLLFSVGLGSKFTISTGAVYAYKPYNTPFGNYRNMAGNANALTQDVLADCRVLDVPLNIDYRFYSKNRNSFSIGTGVSSYFMLSEKYTISDIQYNTQLRSYTIRGRNQHLFGVMNLQATYHRQLNSKFGVSVQPYFKLPLTDIGYGEVRLRSFGVAAGFSWNINQKRTSGR